MENSSKLFVVLSEISNSPIYVFKNNSLEHVYGVVPFFQEVLDRRNLHVSVGGNGVRQCSFAISKSGCNTFVLGPFRSGIYADEELSTAFDKLPVFNERYQHLLDFAVKSFSVIHESEKESLEKLNMYSLKLNFLHSVSPLKDKDSIFNSALQFFMDSFKLSNAVMYFQNSSFRFFNNSKLSTTYSSVENILNKQVADSKSGFYLDIAKDFLTKDIKFVSELPNHVSVFPIVVDRNVFGSVIFYSENKKDYSYVSSLIEELIRIVSSADVFEQVKTSASVDALTGLHNRHFFVPNVKKFIQVSKESSNPVSVLLFDVDDFKKYNDNYGHPKGDVALKSISSVVKSLTPDEGLSARYGGEEFVIALPYDQHKAKLFAENLRRSIQDQCELTVSIGLFTCLNSSADFSDMIAHADSALYKAKNLGKNCVVPFVMVDKALGVIDTLSV